MRRYPPFAKKTTAQTVVSYNIIAYGIFRFHEGMPICRFHELSHTFATMALSSGVDAKTLSSMLGHFSAGFTLDTYTHITNEMQRGAAEKIGGFMETATAKPEPEPEPPNPPEESRCKVIPFERVG